METMLIFGIIVMLAYALQILLGIRQIKHFNAVYSQLRRQGRVAIGRRAGKFRSGTLVMFAIDSKGKVLDAKKMQGVTVAARFKEMPVYIGEDIHYFDTYNPLIRQENKLLRIAIEDARDVFLRTEAGLYQDVPKAAPLFDLGTQVRLLPRRLKLQFKK